MLGLLTTAAWACPSRPFFAHRMITRWFAHSHNFETTYHAPVMWKECIDAMLEGSREEKGKRIFIDGTLGGGGHSAALLEHLESGDVLFGCDVDPDALETASQRLKKYTTSESESPCFVPVQSNFGQLASVLAEHLHPTTQEPITSGSIDGILLDLGMSSHQIDTAERGFAFMKDGPLDMRLGGAQSTSPFTAADICNEFDATEVSRILKKYGDEPRARRIAESICKHRPLWTTSDLVQAVAAVTPEFAKKGRRMGRTATLARVFQALRIFVNDEEKVLEDALLEMAPALLKPGGRLVVLTYHSMEDRATKRVLRDGSIHQVATRHKEKDIYGNYNGEPLPFRPKEKARKATPEEIERNSRARSATLRVGVRQ